MGATAASWRTRPKELWIAVLGLGIALSPTNTKIAGAAWLLVCLAGLVAAVRVPAVPDARAPAAMAWLMACALAAALATAVTLYWPDGPDTLHAEFRLLLAAAATHQIVRRLPISERWRSLMLPAVALACVAAFCKVATTPDRLFLPSNALPWAISVTFLVCLLLPQLLSPTATPRQRKGYGAAVVLGLGAILMSQSRGAFVVLVWMVWLAATSWRQGHPGFRLRNVALGGTLAGVLLASSAWLPSDPLRLRMGWNEVITAEQQGNYNTSLGARIYLWSLAWNSIQESPWVGVGGRERLRRIKEAGTGLPEAQRSQLGVVRNVGHVHNQYLHAAMDGGLIGLASTLAVLAGLGASAWRLRRVDSLASRQMQGVLFMHATAGLSNVNMAHNFYAIMLSLSVAVILIGAGARAGGPEPAPVA
jgi:O-antigen ligase